MSGTVYLVQSGTSGPIKIGLTNLDVSRRVAQLQTGNPFPLRVIATLAGGSRVEKHLHRKFSHLRLSGEWFSPDQAIFDAFEAGRKWPRDPETLPPVTPGGISFLLGTLETVTVRPVYPDGSRHDQIDWDEMNAHCERAAASYEAWEAAQA